MPAAVLVPAIAAVAGGGIAAGASIHGANQQTNANNRAADVTAKSNADTLAFQQSTEAERKREWDLQQEQAKTAWAAEQARRAPYRQAGQNALVSLSQMAGLQAPSTALPPPSDTPPPGWTPGSSSMVPVSSMMPGSSATSPYAPMSMFGAPPARKVAQFSNAPVYGGAI